MDRVIFGKMVNFLGRNGFFAMAGMEIWRNGEKVVIEPVTSKDSVGRCKMEIPTEDVEKVIDSLRKASGYRVDYQIQASPDCITKLVSACKGALETYRRVSEQHGIELDAIPIEDALESAGALDPEDHGGYLEDLKDSR